MRSFCSHVSFAWYFMSHNKWYGSCSVQHNTNSGNFIAILDNGIIQSLYLVTFNFSPNSFQFIDQQWIVSCHFFYANFLPFFSYTRRLGDLDMERVTFLLFIVLLATEILVRKACEDLFSVTWHTCSRGMTSGCCHVTSVCNERGDYICVKHH